MSPQSSDRNEVRFASTREAALARLEEFIPLAQDYSSQRNYVLPGHENVSRLSPAIRHRLILERECEDAVLRSNPASRVEKFRQEVYWRRYWKGWLWLRPQVWSNYLAQLDGLQNDAQYESVREHAARCASGIGPVAVMNAFARELVETGYLHNHARMWFAGWWVHIEGLPWQLGADFFMRHLLDGDPASNTLSWRWVAGLHTAGKTYLPRCDNLERYLAPELLQQHGQGLENLEQPQPRILRDESALPVIRACAGSREPVVKPGELGLWIHEEDLLAEESPLARLKPKTILVTADSARWGRCGYSLLKTAWLHTALEDARARASTAFHVEAEASNAVGLCEALVSWAVRERLGQIAAMRPEVGFLGDLLPAIEAKLRQAGIELLLFERPEDVELRPLASGGFFSFWQKMQEIRPSRTET